MNLELMAYLTDHHRLWAIDESYLLRYKAAAEAHNGIRLEARAPSSSMAVAGNVALIDVSGPISPRATIFTELFGGAAISSLQADFRQAMADDSVKAIVFHYDTPGGEVSAVSDFAGEIFAARGKKPIVAQIGSLCASAGYWLASAADKIVATKAGLSGSIGVITMHADVSAALEREGVKVTVMSAGTYKAEGSPYSALSPEAAAHVQSLVDAAYDDFTGDVAQGRGVTAAQVKKGYGEGRVLSSKAAKAAGLIDGIATLESTLGRLVGRATAGRMRAETGTVDELHALIEEQQIAAAAYDSRGRWLL